MAENLPSVSVPLNCLTGCLYVAGRENAYIYTRETDHMWIQECVNL